ncbi:MAG TPA: methyltransferase domain-containing protein [Anaerolineales bacterium]|nr:methyltransferase domain-containing protein [Anaerolineales bacterium]
MELPFDAPQVIEYCCNLCGGMNRLESQYFHRELATCKRCGANARFRGIIHVLGNLLGEKGDNPLQKWPKRKHISGIGMSDWPGYANLLMKKFSYENTFYDHRPQLDIMKLTEKYLGKYDFVISTDVFEHILAPVQEGFDNLLRLLKSGGHLVFSVPYTRITQTVEHFPGLHDYEILTFRGEKIIVNRDHDGRLQVYDNLVFHGGPGTTLEMRRFCETDVLNRLVQAGFENIKVYDQPQLSIGYYWPELKTAYVDVPLLYGYIISARRPAPDLV